MSIVIRNKNKYLYGIKSKTRRYLYSNPFMLKNYLRMKEIFIKIGSRGIVSGNEKLLFKKVFIETISYCNNDCAFCPASTKAGVKNSGHLMAEDLYIKILNELADISFLGSIAFHCNNEPLLDSRLASWIKRARSLLKTNFFYLYTNGILINTELANKLFKAGLNRIIVNNYSDKHELIPSVKKLVDNSYILRGEVIINYRFKNDYLGNRAGEAPNAKGFLKAPLKIMCLRPLTEIVIGYNGSVPLCCSDGLWKTVTGNVKVSTLKDIWFSDFLKSIKKSLAESNRNCAEICKVCDVLNFPAPKGVRE